MKPHLQRYHRPLFFCLALLLLATAGCGGSGSSSPAGNFAPTVTAISPTTFPATGGGVMTVQGTHFTGPTVSQVTVRLFTTDATGLPTSSLYIPATVVSDTQLTIIVPPPSGPATGANQAYNFIGTVSVQVLTTVGTGNLSINLASPVSAVTQFTYQP